MDSGLQNSSSFRSNKQWNYTVSQQWVRSDIICAFPYWTEWPRNINSLADWQSHILDRREGVLPTLTNWSRLLLGRDWDWKSLSSATIVIIVIIIIIDHCPPPPIYQSGHWERGSRRRRRMRLILRPLPPRVQCVADPICGDGPPPPPPPRILQPKPSPSIFNIVL